MTTDLDRAIIIAGEYRRLVAAGRLAEADQAESTIDELVGHYQYANQLCFLWPSWKRAEPKSPRSQPRKPTTSSASSRISGAYGRGTARWHLRSPLPENMPVRIQARITRLKSSAQTKSPHSSPERIVP